MARVILIAGLPGSGKTVLLDRLVRELGAFGFDDWFQDARGPGFAGGRCHDELARALLVGRPCVLADVKFCERSVRRDAEAGIAALARGVRIEWLCFENDPSACRRNVAQRARRWARDPAFERRVIEELAARYVLPASATSLPVFAAAVPDPELARV